MRAGISSENSSSRKSGTVREVAGALDVVKSKSARPQAVAKGCACGTLRPAAHLRWRRFRLGTTQPMKHLDDSLGARVAVLCAVASLALAAPASADETAYLMYLKGSEGPTAVPMPVLWDARDGANRDDTTDRGAKYEPALTKLELPRAPAY